MPTIPTAVRRLAATHHLLRAPRGPQGDLLDPEGIQAEVEAILAYDGEEELQEAVSHASLPVTQDGQAFGGRRPLQEAEGETPDLDDAEALAAFYAEILNALEVTGDDVEDLAEQADEELNGSGWNVARKPSGAWAPVRDTTELTEAFLLEGGERAPKGGIDIGGKHYPGGRFIPKEAIKNASPEDRIRLEQAQQIAAGKAAEKQQARTARGGVDVGDLSGRLQKYARMEPLTPSEKASAGRAARALLAHHGDLTAHRIEELAQRVDAALKATDRPGVAKYMRKQLSKLHHALQFANEKGVSGDTPGSTPQVHPPTQARADAHGVDLTDLKNIHKYAGRAGLPLTYADEKAILGDAKGRAQREKVGLGASHINAAFEVWRRKKKEEQAAAPPAPTPAPAASEPAPAPVAPAGAKEPWEMTREEYEGLGGGRGMAKGNYDAEIEAALEDGKSVPRHVALEFDTLAAEHQPHILTAKEFRQATARDSVTGPHGPKAPSQANGEHHAAVKVALAAGKPVPPEVLADYPDLAPKPATPSPDDPGFSGTDAQGREWVNGELVPAGESETSPLDNAGSQGKIPPDSSQSATSGGKTMDAKASPQTLELLANPGDRKKHSTWPQMASDLGTAWNAEELGDALDDAGLTDHLIPLLRGSNQKPASADEWRVFLDRAEEAGADEALLAASRKALDHFHPPFPSTRDKLYERYRQPNAFPGGDAEMMALARDRGVISQTVLDRIVGKSGRFQLSPRERDSLAGKLADAETTAEAASAPAASTPGSAPKMGPEKARKTIEDALKTAPQDRPGRIYIPDLRDALNMDPEEFDRALKDMRREEAIRLVAVGDRSRHTSDALRRGMIQGENEAFGYIELPEEAPAPAPAPAAAPAGASGGKADNALADFDSFVQAKPHQKLEISSRTQEERRKTAVPNYNRLSASAKAMSQARSGEEPAAHEVYEKLKQEQPDLTPAQFRALLQQMDDAGEIELRPYTRAMSRLPSPELSLPLRSEVMYFVGAPRRAPAAAPVHNATDPTFYTAVHSNPAAYPLMAKRFAESGRKARGPAKDNQRAGSGSVPPAPKKIIWEEDGPHLVLTSESFRQSGRGQVARWATVPVEPTDSPEDRAAEADFIDNKLKRMWMGPDDERDRERHEAEMARLKARLVTLRGADA